MDVRAIVLIAGPASRPSAECLAGVPIALLPVLGRPVVHHVIERLVRAGVESVAIVSEDAPAAYIRDAQHPRARWIQPGEGNDLWRAIENAFNEFAQGGADLVIALRLGPYVEFDVDKLLQAHLDQRNRVTAVHGISGALPIFAISASRRNDAAFMFRHRLESFRSSCGRFWFSGYSNPLSDAHDLRRLAIESIRLETAITPAGHQIKPGVWVEHGARIHRGARILAPAFIGARSKIRPAVVLTRGAIIEHHSEIDCGTVVEDSTVLPYTYVGAGLDLCHTVAGFHRLFHLPRKVAVEISDPKLLGMASPVAPLRALSAAASLVSFLPRQVLRGLFAPSHREPLTELPAAINSPPAVLQAPAAELEGAAAETDASKFPANLVVARRYGDQ